MASFSKKFLKKMIKAKFEEPVRRSRGRKSTIIEENYKRTRF